MLGRTPGRPTTSLGRAALAATLSIASLAGIAPAQASDGLWDHLMQSFNLKAAPPGPAPDFIERSRPDAAGLGYLPPAMPHKVSPVPVRTPAQIKAQTSALDVAKQRQLHPGGPAPVQLSGGRKPTKAKPAPAPAD